jgi:hypothetical protein
MEKVNGNEMIITKKENQESEKRLVLEVVEILQKDNTFEVWAEALADYLYDIIKETRQKIKKNTNTASLRYRGVIEAIMKKIKETTNIYIDSPITAVKIINNFINKYNLNIHPLQGRHHFFVSIVKEQINDAEVEIEKRFREKMNKQ